MATNAEIAELRLLVAEPTSATYSDATLAGIIDTTSSMDEAARDVWVQKAASYTALANISEGGSSRSMGDLHAKALQMVELFQGKMDRATQLDRSGVIISSLSRG